MSDLTVSDVVEHILAGVFDADLGDVIDAIDARVKAGEVEIGWRIDFDGLVIDTENQTVGEARVVEGVTRQSIAKVPVGDSATIIATIVAAALMERNGLSNEDAFKAVGKHSARALLKSVTKYAIDSPPKDDSGSETPAS